MRLLGDIDELPAGRRLAATLGIFDGVHRGHRRVLRQTVRVAAQLAAEPTVITFEPHPAKVLRGVVPPLLCDPDERLAHIAAAGVTVTVVQRFDHDFAAQTAEEFLRRLARGRDLAAMVMSAESAFGRDRAGTLGEVRRLARPLAMKVVEVDQVQAGGQPISSSRIRELIGAGRLGAARSLLGRPYAVVGEIVHGDGRGRQLGYPTANFGFAEAVALPPDGIYAVRVGWGGEPDPLSPSRRADGVASLGVRPTFGGGRRVLEAYLFDIDEELYGERMRLEFVRRQRGERNFASVDGLITQMDRDAKRARQILAG
jgi:riboflavin kinase / FMN adenylyltransferase